MRYNIHKAVVIGAGTMGAAIAAHFANAGVLVTLLDIASSKLTPEQEAVGISLQDKAVRNAIVTEGYNRMLNTHPPGMMSSEIARLLTLGNLEDDFYSISDADWVIEAVVEDLQIKRDLMARIDKIRSPHSIISSNTSGIPIAAISEECSGEFRKHFLGTHFFNPPRYLKLLEVIPTNDTKPEITQYISWFGEYRLGKGIVLCKDTPNFIANRIFAGMTAFILDYSLQKGYSVDEVDALTGSLIGRPKTATFRLLDLVGIDVMDLINHNLFPMIPHDTFIQPYLSSDRMNALLAVMREKKLLGNKTKAGFYKTITHPDGKKEFLALNVQTMQYELPKKIQYGSVSNVSNINKLSDRLHVLLAGEDQGAEFIRSVIYQFLAYASLVIPEIADTPKSLDDAIRWGFAHEIGPFELWDELGVKETIEKMRRAGFLPALWVEKMIETGRETFYQYEGNRKIGVFHVPDGNYKPIEPSPNQILLKNIKNAADRIISSNSSASVINIGDGVVCFEFHTKVNALDENTLTVLKDALDKVEKEDYEGLVIGNDADNFCAGANILFFLSAARDKRWSDIERFLENFQKINMRMRCFPKPIVVAPVGMALGGGAEIVMHGNRVVAASELSIGLVESRVGLIPAGGGTKEMVRRMINPPMYTPNVDALPFLQQALMRIGKAEISASAFEAKKMRLLQEVDRIVFNRDHLIFESKREVLHLAGTGYYPQKSEKLYAAGQHMGEALGAKILMLKEMNQISEYDAVIFNKLAYVLSGGNLISPTWVDEQHFLDLEREAFMSLCGEERTQVRIKYMLDTGKPLRN
ncbi:MAG: 3-hydroxyacyl-CoA dehydrogenase/enoyl-CoA hydratase family protein [Chloroflexota bacterium]